MNKQKLIYVEDLENALYDEPCDVCDGQNDNGGYWGFSRDALDRIIKIVSTVDAAPVVHGHWEKPHWRNSDYCWNCSVCGNEAVHKEFLWHKNNIYPYCPNCGAKMDE